MQLRYRSVLPLVAICLALAVAPALASKPAPVTAGTPSGSSHQINVGHIPSTNHTCDLGVLPPAANAYGYILPPDDEYYTLIDPAECADCGAAGVKLNVAHMQLYFTEPCNIPVTVSLVPSIEVSPGCLGPNPFAPPLCAPSQYLIDDGGFLNECVDYAFNMPPGCCIVSPAFLEFRFDQGTCATSRPAFCGPNSCVNCRQYNYYPGAGFPGDDLCAVLTPYGLTGNIMYASVECCGNVPTINNSWGKLKSIYR